MEHSKNGQEMVELMNAVESIDMSEEAMLEMVKDPNSASGPGTKKEKSPNDYKPQEIQAMLRDMARYVASGKAPKSWRGDFQSYLNIVGKGMEEFKKIKLGNPEYKEGIMKGDMMNMSYNPNKYDKGSTGQKPSPIRGKKEIKEAMDEDKIASVAEKFERIANSTIKSELRTLQPKIKNLLNKFIVDNKLAGRDKSEFMGQLRSDLVDDIGDAEADYINDDYGKIVLMRLLGWKLD